MKITYKLEGLDCANCAAKIESGVKKIDWVVGAAVNFLTTKMVVEFNENNVNEVDSMINKIIKKIDSGIKITKL